MLFELPSPDPSVQLLPSSQAAPYPPALNTRDLSGLGTFLSYKSDHTASRIWTAIHTIVRLLCLALLMAIAFVALYASLSISANALEHFPSLEDVSGLVQMSVLRLNPYLSWADSRRLEAPPRGHCE